MARIHLLHQIELGALPRFGHAALALAVLGIAGEVLRARNEERVLSNAFADYAAYAATTPRFLPRVNPCGRALHCFISDSGLDRSYRAPLQQRRAFGFF